jgi:hypothetical protein
MIQAIAPGPRRSQPEAVPAGPSKCLIPSKANFRHDPTQPAQMNRVFSNYPRPQRHFVALPEDFDRWFTVNHFIPGPVCWTGDVPSEKVICTVQLNRAMVWQLIAAQLCLS